jgi:hypothetical protein
VFTLGFCFGGSNSWRHWLLREPVATAERAHRGDRRFRVPHPRPYGWG